MGLRKTPAALVAIGAAAALAITACSSSSSTSSAATGSQSSSSSSAPAELVLWRMGADVPAQDAWLTGVVNQWHQANPQYANTKVKTVWVSWGNRATDWSNALTSGSGGPDITELGNTDTPTEATLGGLADISSYVNSWSGKPNLVQGMLANDTQGSAVYAVPWFGGVRGIWYRTDQFQKAGISSPPTSWAELLSDAQKLMKTFPGTYGFDAITHDTNAFASFIWGAGGQIATQDSSGKWTAQLTTPADEAAIKFYVSLVTQYHVSPTKYIGQAETGVIGATSGGANTDFALGKLDMYVDGPWATANMPANPVDKTGWASFPIPSQNGPDPAPVFAGGSDLGVFKTSKNQAAAWSLISVMDNVQNSTTFATQQQFFFPPYTTATSTSYPSSNLLMAGFAKAAANGQVAPLNAKYWSTADGTPYYIIPSMLKALMTGADFNSTVAKANTDLTNALNNGKP
jgi:ABC-type glycerol-3-phosphate transport system substrate-binding protein